MRACGGVRRESVAGGGRMCVPDAKGKSKADARRGFCSWGIWDGHLLDSGSGATVSATSQTDAWEPGARSAAGKVSVVWEMADWPKLCDKYTQNTLSLNRPLISLLPSSRFHAPPTGCGAPSSSPTQPPGRLSLGISQPWSVTPARTAARLPPSTPAFAVSPSRTRANHRCLRTFHCATVGDVRGRRSRHCQDR